MPPASPAFWHLVVEHRSGVQMGVDGLGLHGGYPSNMPPNCGTRPGIRIAHLRDRHRRASGLLGRLHAADDLAHGVAAAFKQRAEMPAHKPGAAGHADDAHRRFLPRST